MFSTTLKQSVATLGVVAGLLAAAGPASAQILDGPVLAKAGPQPEAGGDGSYRQGATLGTQVGSQGVKDDEPLETVSSTTKGAADRGEVTGLEPTVKAPANATSAGISGTEMTDAVKAPASPTSEVFTSVSNVAPLHGDATTIWVRHEAARNGAVTNHDSAGHTAHVEVGMGMSEDFLKAPQLDVAGGNDTLAAAEQGVWGPIVYVGSAGVKAPNPASVLAVGVRENGSQGAVQAPATPTTR